MCVQLLDDGLLWYQATVRANLVVPPPAGLPLDAGLVIPRPPRLGCSATLRCSIDGRTGLCSERRYPYVFHCSKTKPCSSPVLALLVAGFSAAPFLELSRFFSQREVTSGLDDAIAAF